MKILKRLACSVAAAVFLNSWGASANGVVEASVELSPKIFEVSNTRELGEAVKSAKSGDTVRFNADMLLDVSFDIDHSMLLDLNGHTATLGDNCKINIGKKAFSHVHTDKVWHEGGYVLYPEDRVTYSNGQSVRSVTFVSRYEPGYYEYKSTDVYDYDDSIEVDIFNGSIFKSDGSNGSDGARDVSKDYDGKNGKTPCAPVNIISGFVRFKKVVVRGGNGGNGGEGGYQSLWHIPFGGGRAGNGGNGGKK